MIKIEYDVRKMQYILRIDYDDVRHGALNQDNYNNLICRISKLIYEEIRRRL